MKTSSSLENNPGVLSDEFTSFRGPMLAGRLFYGNLSGSIGPHLAPGHSFIETELVVRVSKEG